MRLRPFRAPRHRARATKLRRRRIRAAFSASACVLGLAVGPSVLATPPRPTLLPVVEPLPVLTPTPVAVSADLVVTAPPTTIAAPVTGLPLPVQYLHDGRVDQGVDYLAPGGTPLYAMGPGIIIQEGGPGTAGFGPNIPVLQITAGPLAGRTVYYGHAGPDVVPVGTVVAEGQQISIVGFGRVGRSSAPHLEIGFWPLGGMGAGRPMRDYLDAMLVAKTPVPPTTIPLRLSRL